jgi:hypothetical protein
VAEEIAGDARRAEVETLLVLAISARPAPHHEFFVADVEPEGRRRTRGRVRLFELVHDAAVNHAREPRAVRCGPARPGSSATVGALCETNKLARRGISVRP